MRKAKVTIADVARDAGVSTASVSRALNQPDAVGAETRARIQRAVDTLGFRLNTAARALRRQETRRILVPVPSTANLVLAGVLAGLNTVLNAQSYATLVIDTDFGQKVDEILRLVSNREVDGVISMDAHIHNSLAPSIGDLPLVYASEWPNASEHAFVKSDNFAGGQMAAAHLIGLGHRYLGQLSGARAAPMALERRDGFLAEIDRQGLTVDDDWHLYSNWRMNDGLAAAQRLIAARSRGENVPTGWFFASDELALAFMGELLRSGIDVPGHISVVGFDDIPQARYLHPALTTVRQDPTSLGASAAHALLAHIQGASSGEPFRATVPVELAVRGSTGPLKGQGQP